MSGTTYSTLWSGMDHGRHRDRDGRGRLSDPRNGAWALALWDGNEDRPSQVDVQRVQFTLTADEQVLLAGADVLAVSGAGEGAALALSAASSEQTYDLLISCRVRGGHALRNLLASVTHTNVTNAVLNRVTAENALPSESVLDGAVAARLSGAWWICVGPTVRVFPAGACPPTHLPVYGGTQTEAAILDKALQAVCVVDEHDLLAPDMLFSGDVERARAFSDRLHAAHAHLLNPAEFPPVTSAELLAQQERASAVEAGLTRFDERAPWSEPSPDDPAIDAVVACSTAGFRPLDPAVFFEWAAKRGFVAPVRIDTRFFPGALRAMAYPGNWYAILYRDHVRVGRYGSGPISRNPSSDSGS